LKSKEIRGNSGDILDYLTNLNDFSVGVIEKTLVSGGHPFDY